jgi:hypothetical protein
VDDTFREVSIMVKVTPHENLVPDTRDRWVKGRSHHDFINNQLLAHRFIRAASQFFHLRKGSAVFSGDLHRCDEQPFTIKLWHEGKVVRTLVLKKLGYEGALHVEIQGDFNEAVGWDLIGHLAVDPSKPFVMAVS